MPSCKPATNSLYPSEAITVNWFTCRTWFPNVSTSMRSPFWLTQRRRPRPTSCLFCVVEFPPCFRVQIWNTFGLSQPSRNAECENIKRTGLLKESKRSLSFKIKLYADISSLSSLLRLVELFILRPCLSMLKYPECVAWTSIFRRYCSYGVSNKVRYSLRIDIYSSSKISPYSEFISLPSSSYLRYFATSSIKNKDRHLIPRS